MKGTIRHDWLGSGWIRRGFQPAYRGVKMAQIQARRIGRLDQRRTCFQTPPEGQYFKEPHFGLGHGGPEPSHWR